MAKSKALMDSGMEAAEEEVVLDGRVVRPTHRYLVGMKLVIEVTM